MPKRTRRKPKGGKVSQPSLVDAYQQQLYALERAIELELDGPAPVYAQIKHKYGACAVCRTTVSRWVTAWKKNGREETVEVLRRKLDRGLVRREGAIDRKRAKLDLEAAKLEAYEVAVRIRQAEQEKPLDENGKYQNPQLVLQAHRVTMEALKLIEGNAPPIPNTQVNILVGIAGLPGAERRDTDNVKVINLQDMYTEDDGYGG